MTSPAAIPAAFTLWHRRGPGEPWRIVATAATSAALTARQASMPGGDYFTVPAGRDPNASGARH